MVDKENNLVDDASNISQPHSEQVRIGIFFQM